MKLCWVFSATLVVLALTIPEVSSQNKDCTKNGKTIANKKKWLKNNCKKEYSCENGKISSKNYDCPANAKCQGNNGFCKCKSGYKVAVRTPEGILSKCVSKDSCKSFGKYHKKNTEWLSNNCRQKLTCKNGDGKILDNKYECPKNSACNKGQCKCNDGWKEKSKSSKGLLTSCKQEQSNNKNCVANGKTYLNNGNKWLRGDCKERYRCKNGQIQKHSHKCPDNAECVNGDCKCKAGFKDDGKRSKGLLKKCLVAKAESCKDNGKEYADGDFWIRNDCKKILKCDKGNTKTVKSQNCPSNSKCTEQGYCKCENGYKSGEKKKYNNLSVLKKCEKDEGCEVEGKKFAIGKKWLNNKCDKKFTCTKKKTVSKSFRCPPHSSCKLGGQCVCDFGYVKKSVDKDNILRRCKESKDFKCKGGFKRAFGRCLSIKKDGKLSFFEAHNACKKKGGRLLLARGIFALAKLFGKRKYMREGNFYVMGSPDLSAKELKGYKNEAAKLFVLDSLKKYKCDAKLRYKAFQRFSGRAKAADWNFQSTLSSRCLVINRNGPRLERCNKKMGYICEQGGDKETEEEGDSFWSEWYSLEKPDDKGEKESLVKILKKLNKQFTGKKDRLCKKPLAMECREVGTTKLISKKNNQGYKLKRACEKKMFYCKNKDQKDGRKCPNVEVRFKCVEDDSNDCSVVMVRKACENKGRKCKNRRTGAICVKQKKKRSKKSKINVSKCMLASKEYSVYRCKATGDPHYETLDGRSFNFMGVCSYDFVSTCNQYIASDTFPEFSIMAKNYKRVPNVKPAWTKSFTLTLGDNVYTFKQGEFLVNDIPVNPIAYQDDQLQIVAKCRGKTTVLSIETNFCLKISWDNAHGLYVYVPEVYKKYTCGLCGDFDGNKNNDMTRPGSTNLMTQKEIDDEFRVAGGEDDTICPVPEPDTPCAKDMVEKLSGPKFCGILNVDGDSPIVKVIASDGSDESSRKDNLDRLREEFKGCIEDNCWDTTTNRCQDLEDVMTEIHEALGIIDEAMDTAWRKFAGCENTGETRCAGKPNMVYDRKAITLCQNTCINREAEADCDDENEQPACVCKEGFFLDAEMNCVPEEECDKNCEVEMESGGSFTLNNGKEYWTTPCYMKVKCVDGELVEEKVPKCSIHAECVNKGSKCRCHDGYVGDGVECKTDLSCKRGYTAIGEKCYKFVPKSLAWHPAAINCGRDGSVLARYDDLVGEELGNFFQMIPDFYLRSKAQSRRINCRKGRQCKIPKNYVGLAVRMKNPKKDKQNCQGQFALAVDKRSIVVTGDKCNAKFTVKMVKVSLIEKAKDFRAWIAGNSFVVGQNERENKERYQIDPPSMIDLSGFPDPNGCFQANLNKKGKLIVSPNSKCSHKKPSICEYDNNGKIPHDPLNFKRLKEKGSFEEARKACAELNRPLVEIHNDLQNKKVRRMLKQLNHDGWIGASYSPNKNKFVWSNNKDLVYNNWKNNEPNNYNKNERSDEECVAMDKSKGRWYTDDCNEPNYPICGPPLDMEPASYTKYYRVKGFTSIPELRQKLAREGNPDYVCERPISIECSAREDNDGPWRNNYNQQSKAIIDCNANKIRCKRGRGLKCNTLRVRFMCPSDDNQCETLKGESIDPCKGGRLCLPVRNHYVCKCPLGAMWSKELQKCHTSCGYCHASGDPHYTTYNGQRYDFMGTCMYKFAGACELAEFKDSPNFDVFTKNKACGNRGASCIEYIEVHLRNIEFKFKGVTRKENFVFKVPRGPSIYYFNDAERDEGEFNMGAAFKVVRKRNYFSLQSDALALTVLFSGSSLKLNLPDKFVDKMCGLCGDCKTDQFRMKDGSLVSVPKRSGSNNRYDNSKIIAVANEWIEPFDGSDPETCKVVGPVDECSEAQKTELAKPNKCGVFMDADSVLKSCFSKVDAQQYYDDCLVDACHDDPMESICKTVKVYVQKCMDAGGHVNWRTPEFCPMDCGTNKIYRPDASCEPMCGRDVQTVCEEPREEGCICPAGLMRQGEKCVEPSKCGCDVEIREDYTVLVPLGKSKLLSRCIEKATCVVLEDGSGESDTVEVELDPKAICIEDPDPKIDCVRGYILQDDNSCKRDPDACSEEYQDREGMCINVPLPKKIWRQAMKVCNQKDGTLVKVNSDAKLDEIGKIMVEKNYEQVFISGQVIAKVDANGKVIFSPRLAEGDRNLIELYSFDFEIPATVSIQLSEEVPVENLNSQETILALVARRGADGKASIVAVPRDTETNFVCEERDPTPEEEKWYGPCNSDSFMDDDGDQETKLSLRKNKDCLVCPYPMEVGCSEIPGATGTMQGECKMTKKGTYYSCDQGTDCKDMAVSTKCTRDKDECESALHDCPANSKCINTVGAYYCKCDEDTPIMIKGQCYRSKQCHMSGPQVAEDFEYSLKGLSDVKGYIGYSCPFKVFETCARKYDQSSGMPLLSIYEYSRRTDRGMVQVVGGWVKDPFTGDMKYFAVYDALLRQGKFMYGDTHKTMAETTLGFGCLNIKTSFAFQPPNMFVVQHFDNIFRWAVTFPVNFALIVSEDYANMACGMCTKSPPAENEVITLTPDEEAELSGAKFSADGCSVNLNPPPATTTPLPPPPPTTVPATTTTTTPAPTTTTTTPPPEEECDQETQDFCAALAGVCTFELGRCMLELCGSTNDFCTYLMTAEVGECARGAMMSGFLNELNCDSMCTGDMSFNYVGDDEPERCMEPETDSTGYAAALSPFACTCNDGFKLSGSECVPKEECGCVNNDDMYFKANEEIMSPDCSAKALCVGDNNVKLTLLGCNDKASCVSTEKGPQCMCNEGFYGDGYKPDGCKPPIEEDETMTCYDKLNSEGVKTQTCTCKMGYVSNCTRCIDYDECADNAHDCDKQSEKCENTIGSYVCSCALGFEAVDGKCKDIDECQRKTSYCGPNEGCVNDPGTYRCACCAGFAYDMVAGACVKDPEGVEITTSQPKCCLECDLPDLCDEADINPTPYCYLDGAKPKPFKSYTKLFQYFCVNNLVKNDDSVVAGPCPIVDPYPGGEPTDSPGGENGNPTEGSSEETEGPGGEGEGEGEGEDTTPASKKPTPLSPPSSCNAQDFCTSIPPPPPALKNGPVCGPADKINKQTFPTYCDMAKIVCITKGGPSNMPTTSIDADSGECKKTTTTTTTTTTPPPPPPDATEESGEPNPTEVGATAPDTEGPRPSPETTLPAADPLFTEWTPWSRCRPGNSNAKCGVGKQGRRRSTLDYKDGREVLPVMPDDLYEDRPCFKACDPDDPDFNESLCEADGVCGEDDSKVCAALGKQGPFTFENECTLNIKACLAGKKPAVLYKGECGDDNAKISRGLCESNGGRGLPLRKKLDKVYPNKGWRCVSEPVTIHTCRNLGCRGGFENCCVATGYETIKGPVKCFSLTTGNVESDEGSYIEYPTATGCRCSENADDEDGSERPPER